MTATVSHGRSDDPKAAAFSLIAADRAYEIVPRLEHWLRKIPNDAVAWQLLGNAYRNEQQAEAAYMAFERFASLRPSDPKGMLGLAMVSLESGRPAARLFGQLIATGQGSPDIILASVDALTAEGEVAVAEALLDRAVTERPDWIAGHDALASLRWRCGDAAAVDASFAAAVHKVSALALWSSWIRTLVQVEHFGAAADVLRRARELFGHRLELDAIDASIAIGTGDPERADALFNAVRDLDDVGTRLGYIRHCIRRGALDRAERAIKSLADGPHVNAVLPYQSIVWRLRDDARAAWLDGTPPFFRVAALPLPLADLDAVTKLVDKTGVQRRHPLGQSPRGGTQTEGNLLAHHDPAIQRLRGAIVEAVRAYARDLPVAAGHPFLDTPRVDIRFAGSWSIRLNAGGYHCSHTHPKGWMSGVLYLSVPSREHLGDGANGALALGRVPADLETGLPEYCQIAPEPGRIALFPSTMWHATVPFDTGTRLTVAFDIMRPRF